MKTTIKKLAVSLLLAVFIFSVAGIAGGQSQLAQVSASTVITGKVSSSKLNIRASKSTSSKKLKTIRKGKTVNILEAGKKWVKVSVAGVIGYTKGSYIKTSYGTASDLYKNAIAGRVTRKTLNIYSSKNGSSSTKLTLKKGTRVKVLTTNSTWVKVKVGDVIGYVKGKYVKTANGTASSNSSKGESVVAYARRFLGNPYVYGGSSLTHGTDCSGFVMSIYRHFGRSLPHSSYALRSVGRRVSGGIRNAKPGDIICYSGHVAIYMGNNRVIHASNPSTGIKITNNASYRHIVAIRRIF